jgi:tripartite-type tricarboxylate transporter receptor subunit TctC
MFPSKPVRIVVPYTAGGGTDSVARGLASQLSELWKQPVLVENRPGAATVIGADAVAKSAPDGHTLLFSDSATFVINPHLSSKLPYDPHKDFAPISLVVRLAPVVAVSNVVPASNMREFVAYVKANPGKLTYASFGNGSYPHVVSEQLKRMAGIDLIHVPYKGSAAAITDMLGGQLSMLIVTLSVFEQHEKAGRLKVLAAATDKRLSLRPDLPTVAESGVPGYSVSVWFGLAAPGKTPDAILDRIHADVAGILADPAYRAKFVTGLSLEPGGLSRAQFAQLLREELGRWGELVRASGAAKND